MTGVWLRGAASKGRQPKTPLHVARQRMRPAQAPERAAGSPSARAFLIKAEPPWVRNQFPEAGHLDR